MFVRSKIKCKILYRILIHRNKPVSDFQRFLKGDARIFYRFISTPIMDAYNILFFLIMAIHKKINFIDYFRLYMDIFVD